jgi:hypothetical protein
MSDDLLFDGVCIAKMNWLLLLLAAIATTRFRTPFAVGSEPQHPGQAGGELARR